MRIMLHRRQMVLLFVLVLVMFVVLSSLLYNALAPVHGWQIMVFALKAAAPNMMNGSGAMYGQ